MEHSTTNTDISSRLIVSELLCYIQDKMCSMDHELLIKTISEFYTDIEIHAAKKLLFENCKETFRFKTYNKDAAKMDCRDMLNKLNEVGLDNCPSFVAKSMNRLPMTTPDAFNMAKLSKDIASVLKIEDNVVTSFYALSCLQKDFKYVMDKCASIDILTKQIDNLQQSIDKRYSRRIFDSDSSDSDSSGSDSSESDSSDSEDEASDDNEDSNPEVFTADDVTINVRDEHPRPVSRPRDGPSSTSNITEQHGTDVCKNTDKPCSTHIGWLTEDGFQMGRHVVPKDGHSRVKYSDATRKTSTRVFTNTNRQQNITLRTASQTSHDRRKNNNGYSRNKQCEIFLSNLHSDTSEQEIMRYMRAHYHGYFKVESIRTQYSDYASFKVVAPMNLKNKLLNKSNWVENIYVRPFYSKPRYY